MCRSLRRSKCSFPNCNFQQLAKFGSFTLVFNKGQPWLFNSYTPTGMIILNVDAYILIIIFSILTSQKLQVDMRRMRDQSVLVLIISIRFLELSAAKHEVVWASFIPSFTVSVPKMLRKFPSGWKEWFTKFLPTHNIKFTHRHIL